MGLKLNTASSGSVTLEPANTASNYTLTVPAQTGTVVIQNGSNNLLMNSGYGSDATAYGCRAWVNFNGTGTVAIRASGNVSSITDNGTGYYTVNFTTAMPDANYSAVAGVFHRAGVNGSGMLSWENPYSTTQLFMYVKDHAETSYDAVHVCVAIFR